MKEKHTAGMPSCPADAIALQNKSDCCGETPQQNARVTDKSRTPAIATRFLKIKS